MPSSRKRCSKTPTENIISFTEDEGFAVIEELMKSYQKDRHSGRIDVLAESVNCKYLSDELRFFIQRSLPLHYCTSWERI